MQSNCVPTFWWYNSLDSCKAYTHGTQTSSRYTLWRAAECIAFSIAFYSPQKQLSLLCVYKLMPSHVRVVFLSPTNLHIFWYFACGPNNHAEDNNIEGNIHNDLTTYAAEGSRCAFNRLVVSIVANVYCVFFWHCTMIS